jgi:hypothetical protein
MTTEAISPPPLPKPQARRKPSPPTAAPSSSARPPSPTSPHTPPLPSLTAEAPSSRRRKSAKPSHDSPSLPSDEELAVLLHRPRQRSECPTFRPCPFVSCRYHLYLDVTRRGRLRINFPERELDDLEVTCALDVAEEGPKTLEEIGRIMGGISRERVRQIEQAALNALRSQGGSVLVEFVSERTAEMQLEASRAPAPPPPDASPKFIARRRADGTPLPIE